MTRRSSSVRAAAALAPFLLLALGLVPASLAGQSYLNSGGLGLPVDPLDARTRALGGPGVGLLGGVLLPTDPAAAADLPVPGVTFTGRSSWIDVPEGAGGGSLTGTRFPLFGASYPVRDWGVATLTVSGLLDQRWTVEREVDITLGDEVVPATDRFLSDGGVSTLQLGFAHRVSPSLAVGISAGTYTGKADRRFIRTFDTTAVSAPEPFEVTGLWRFSGPTATLGALADVGGVARLGASVTLSGDLQAEPSENTEGSEAAADLPAQWRVGLSGVLAPGILATLGMTYANWGDDAGDLAGGGVGGAFSWGGGIELGRTSFLGRQAPVRVGYRRATLPFRFEGEDPTESGWTAGLGLLLAGSEAIALARADLALERGERSAGAFSESFWRATVSLRLSGL